MGEKNKRKQIAWIIVLIIAIIGIVSIVAFSMNNNNDGNKLDSENETILTPQDPPEDGRLTMPNNAPNNVSESHKTP